MTVRFPQRRGDGSFDVIVQFDDVCEGNMGSWQHAFMFPGDGEELRPGEAVGLLCKSGFGFESRCYGAVVVDSHGHLEYTETVKLSAEPVEELKSRLNGGEQLLAQCGNKDLYLVLTSGVHYRNPHDFETTQVAGLLSRDPARTGSHRWSCGPYRAIMRPFEVEDRK